MLEGAELSQERVEEGDLILINGPPGDHGISILLARESLDIQTDLESDCAPLGDLIERLVRELGPEIKFMRDPTRGGVATVLNEVATSSGTDLVLRESDIPLRPQVKGVCEILGLDPLYLANEGKVVLVVSRDAEKQALDVLKAHPLGLESAIIGRAEKGEGRVYIETGVGGSRLLDVLVEDQLPRIC
jgi:hydrogenase expression/formation protein HypE